MNGKVESTLINNQRFAEVTTWLLTVKKNSSPFLKPVETESRTYGLDINFCETKVIDRWHALKWVSDLKDFETVNDSVYLGSPLGKDKFAKRDQENHNLGRSKRQYWQIFEKTKG